MRHISAIHQSVPWLIPWRRDVSDWGLLLLLWRVKRIGLRLAVRIMVCSLLLRWSLRAGVGIGIRLRRLLVRVTISLILLVVSTVVSLVRVVL